MLTFPGSLLPAQHRSIDDPLLLTKLQLPPMPGDLVARPRLVARLDPAPGQQLTCLCAPTGYGKTTLLRAWAEATTRPVAWVALDAGDNDPARFWRYVITALRVWSPDAGEYALTLLRTPELPPLEYVVTALLNSLAAAPERLSLVLDDYHLIEDDTIHHALRFLLDHLPRDLHVVVTGRGEPPLGLPRRRARGELVELHASDLRFSDTEAHAFLNGARELGLTPDDVATLDARTEGWAAGLRLAALAMREQPDRSAFIAGFGGSHRSVVDYLADEVLDQLPPDIAELSLRSAILDRLSGPLCDALTGRDDGQALLEQLERSNGFLLPLDERREWYRYQPIFAEVLRERLRRDAGGCEQELHRRAARWLYEHGYADEAVAHAFAGNDLELVATVVTERAYWMLSSGELETVRGWLERLPPTLVQARPVLGCIQAWVSVLMGRTDAAERALTAVERRECELGTSERVSEVTAIRAFIARLNGDLSRAIALSQRALELTAPDALALRRAIMLNLGIAHWWSFDADNADRALRECGAIAEALGDACGAVIAICHRARMHASRGRLHRAEALFREAEELARERDVTGYPSQSFVHLGFADVLVEWHDLDGASARLEQCVRLGVAGGKVDHVIVAYLTLVAVRLWQHDLDGARAMVEQARLAWQRHPAPHLRTMVEMSEVLTWLAEGNLPAAAAWADEAAPRLTDEVDVVIEAQRMALAQVRLAQGRPDEALAVLAPVRARAVATCWDRCMVETLALEAVILRAQGQLPAALATLGRALVLAEPEGIIFTIASLGAPMADLLRRLPLTRVSADYRDRLVAACGVPAGATAQLRGTLSDRELEVLRGIDAGLSNREIAEALFVTVGTVKRHTNSIYSKLDVASRTQAIARARALGIND